MKALAALLAAVLLPAVYAKEKPDSSYQDAVLVDFHTAVVGSHCASSGDTQGTVNDNGNLNATTDASTTCSDTRRTVYRVSLGDHVYSLESYVGADKKAALLVPIAGLAYVIATQKDSALYGVLPGTHVQVRSEPGGIFYVRVGKKESRYKLMGAE